jgi:hypothetical protein
MYQMACGMKTGLSRVPGFVGKGLGPFAGTVMCVCKGKTFDRWRGASWGIPMGLFWDMTENEGPIWSCVGPTLPCKKNTHSPAFFWRKLLSTHVMGSDPQDSIFSTSS